MMAATLDAFGDQIAASARSSASGARDDMAGAALFLASRAGAYLTGAIIPGGRGHRHAGLTGQGPGEGVTRKTAPAECGGRRRRPRDAGRPA